MKRLIEETDEEGFMGLMGKRITIFACRYIYTGKLVGVNDECVKLTDCGIVYETGPFTEKEWKDYQKLPHDVYIQKSAIESFGVMK